MPPATALRPLLSSLRHAALVGAWLVFMRMLLQRLLSKKRVKMRSGGRNQMDAVMDTRRQAAVVKGEAIDHAGAVVEAVDDDFDLNVTIFASVKGVVQRELLRRQLSRVPHWCDSALQALQAWPTPEAPLVDRQLSDFMLNECDFKMEHADGSFMDHVVFCHNYAAAHYKAQSPRVLLLHSILGVGTNVFPLKASKIPQLAKLVSPEEMRQIEAFPTFLRLLLEGQLLNELKANIGRLDKLDGVALHRVIDNKELNLTAADLWVQLNYQLIHLIDFLPIMEWCNRGDPFLWTFLQLRRLLLQAGQCQAKVDLSCASGDTQDEAKVLAAFQRPMPMLKRAFARKAIRRHSADVGHSLTYHLGWRM